jgi:hypothetical protein
MGMMSTPSAWPGFEVVRNTFSYSLIVSFPIEKSTYFIPSHFPRYIYLYSITLLSTLGYVVIDIINEKELISFEQI